MKKSICIFLLAVLLPGIVLGWLALRSAGEQQIILERQAAELAQQQAENFAAATRALIDDERRAFAETVRRLLAEGGADALAGRFTAALLGAWPRRSVGFALVGDGRLLTPTAKDAQVRIECQQFLRDQGAFLGNRAAAEVFPVAIDELNKPELLKGKMGSVKSKENYAQSQASQQVEAFVEKQTLNEPVQKRAAPAPAQAQAEVASQAPDNLRQESRVRNVMPQQIAQKAEATMNSTLWSATAGFRDIVAGSDEGMVTRFVQDRLNIIFWLRPEQAPHLIFGCLIDAADLRDLWPAILPEGGAREFAFALLDDKARPVVTHPAGHQREWKRPFVASEIGEALPHWETALYLLRPEQLRDTARSYRRTLGFLIAAALGAIALGGWLVVADARRQLALAQQKTDFVSNVSHELKTPLTSIRMFAELMLGGRTDEAKMPQYLRIIMVEAERLTRLINNVLDFAKLERRQRHIDRRPLDLHEVIARTWEAHELHLGEAGFTTRWQDAPGPYPVIGDEDVLAQILVNLLSNAEKYSNGGKHIELHTYLDAGAIHVSVLDRGPGVPAGEERKIFEAFYRAHDSLSSGIQGSGLGLTLAQQLAREHGGDITYRPREGGGSSFTLRIPLTTTPK